MSEIEDASGSALEQACARLEAYNVVCHWHGCERGSRCDMCAMYHDLSTVIAAAREHDGDCVNVFARMEKRLDDEKAAHEDTRAQYNSALALIGDIAAEKAARKVMEDTIKAAGGMVLGDGPTLRVSIPTMDDNLRQAEARAEINGRMLGDLMGLVNRERHIPACDSLEGKLVLTAANFNALVAERDEYKNGQEVLGQAYDLENTRLRDALRDVFALIEEGWLIRDTSGDQSSDWAMKTARKVQRLAAAYQALDGGKPMVCTCGQETWVCTCGQETCPAFCRVHGEPAYHGGKPDE